MLWPDAPLFLTSCTLCGSSFSEGGGGWLVFVLAFITLRAPIRYSTTVYCHRVGRRAQRLYLKIYGKYKKILKRAENGDS